MPAHASGMGFAALNPSTTAAAVKMNPAGGGVRGPSASDCPKPHPACRHLSPRCRGAYAGNPAIDSFRGHDSLMTGLMPGRGVHPAMSLITASLGRIAAPERRTMGVACGAHFLHDGYTDLLYVLLPLWQAEFGLGYAEVGLLRALYTGPMAGFQVPAGAIAERIGGPLLLGLGTALVGVGYLLAGASAGFIMLAVALAIGGLGASVQHPIAANLVAQAFAGRRSRMAFATYNFSGDLGKMAFPAATAGLLMLMPWRSATVVLGVAASRRCGGDPGGARSAGPGRGSRGIR